MSEAKFNKAVAIIQALPADGPIQTSTDDKLFFYKYFKQATVGNNETERPGMFNFAGKAKWEAWTSVKDTPKEECWEKYVTKLIEILNSVGDENSKKLVAEIEAAA
ncbi:acyl-CoA-binding protein [Pholiota conissans]|uniref:Acyl-CoA-binding protein n=1 Tax=Pholiota conissans TaxID=109636 RepID=A0A9P5ZFV2_9AGAR|nr:acyl-CoA-binding protein [Pholiota conissans]